MQERAPKVFKKGPIISKNRVSNRPNVKPQLPQKKSCKFVHCAMHFIHFSERVNLIYRARNAIGSVTQNYSLEVSGLNPLSSHGPLVVVTGISPVNSSIIQGQSAKLTCSVRSQDIPHIKWLKQISKNTPILTNQENILNVRDDRYKILPTAKDIKINQGEYINILTLENVDLQDNGTYFCFVTKNGLNSLTFKSATVFVMPSK